MKTKYRYELSTIIPTGSYAIIIGSDVSASIGHYPLENFIKDKLRLRKNKIEKLLNE